MSYVSLIEAPPAGLGLLAYYRMDAASGTSETDASGNGKTGTYSASGVTLGQAGALVNDTDKAVALDGVAGVMSNAGNVLSGQNKVTFVFAMKYNGSAWPSTTQGIVNYGAASTAGNMALAAVSGSKLQVSMSIAGVTHDAVTTPAPTVGAYHLFVLTLDRTQAVQLAQFGLIIDGVASTLSAVSGETTAVTGNFATTGTLHLGSNADGASGFLPATLDEVAIFSGIMTLTQAQQLYGSMQGVLASCTYSQVARQTWGMPVQATVTAVATEGTLSYVWTLTSVPAGSALTTASISGQGTAAASLAPDVEGSYALQCVVTDSGGNSSTVSGSTEVMAGVKVQGATMWHPSQAKVWNGTGWV